MPEPRSSGSIFLWGAIGLFLIAACCLAQPGKQRLPTSEEVGSLQRLFQSENEHLLKTKLAAKFLPEYMDRANVIARRGEAALASGRLLQAAEAFRQARWQLPYEGVGFPGHVARVFGNFRLRHADEILGVAFSPDGQRLATASRDHTVKIWDMHNGHELTAYREHQRYVRMVVFGPDGKWIASAGGDADVHVWDPQSGKQIRTLKSDSEYVTALAISSDGQFVFAGCSDRKLKIFEVETGKIRRTIGDFTTLGGVRSLAISPDGKRFAAGAESGQTRLWQYPDVVTQDSLEYWTRDDHGGSSNFLTFSPDSKRLVRCSLDGIKVYEVQMPGGSNLVREPVLTIAPVNDRKKDRIIPFVCAALSKDSKILFAGSGDGVIRIYDLESGQPAGTYKGHNAEITALAFNPEGTQLASASADYTVRLWNFDIVVHARQMVGHTDAIWAADFSPDGQRIVSGSADKTAMIWDMATGFSIRTAEHGSAGLTAVRYSPDGKSVLVGGGDKELRLLDAGSGALKQKFVGHTGAVTSAAFDKAGEQIVSGGADRLVITWSVASGQALQKVDVQSLVMAVGFAPAGNLVAVGTVDRHMRLIDAKTGVVRTKWVAHAGAVAALAFDGSGDYLATGGFDGLVRIWQMAEKEKLIATLATHNGPVSAVAFRADGQHLVSAGSDRLVRLWKKGEEGFKESQVFKGHQDWVTALAFSRDGYFVLSGSADKTLRVWEVASKELPLTAEHTGAVNTIATSPDGKWLASGATDQTIKIWERASGKEIATLRGHTDAILGLAFAPDGKTLYSSGADRNVRCWDPGAGKEKPALQFQFQLTGFVEPVPALAVSADGSRLLVWEPVNERGSSLVIFRTDTGDEVAKCLDKDRHVVSAGFSLDGKTAVLGAKDGSVRVWHPLEDHKKPAAAWSGFDKDEAVTALAAGPDGSFAILGSVSGKVVIHESASGKQLIKLGGHQAALQAVAVSPDGAKVASASIDGVVKVWERGSGKELRSWSMPALSRERGGFVLQLAFTRDGRQLLTANANTTLFLLETEKD